MEKTNDIDGDRLELEALRIAQRAHHSIEQLQTHRGYRASEYAERIKRLRKKFNAVDVDFDAIETLYGVGYRFKEQ